MVSFASRKSGVSEQTGGLVHGIVYHSGVEDSCVVVDMNENVGQDHVYT